MADRFIIIRGIELLWHLFAQRNNNENEKSEDSRH